MIQPSSSASSFWIHAPRLFDGEEMRGPSRIRIVEGLIAEISPWTTETPGTDDIGLPPETIVAPGFIDTQVNGGGGVLLNDDPTPEAIRIMVEAHRRFGTTGLLPTLITDLPARLDALAAVAAEAMAIPGVLGFHLEGPFINPARKGIHPESCIRPMDEAGLATLRRFAGHGRSLVTLAPECLPAGTISRLVASGLIVSVGHSNASAGEIEHALGEGLRGATHLFNAMSQIAPRSPGVTGAVLGSGQVFAGIICDGLHVDPLNVRIAHRAIGRDRLMLVTDAMSLVGSEQSEFALQGRTIRRDGNKLSDADGTLAGAHLSMIEAVEKAVALMQVPLEDALIMASRTPAAFLGLADSRGRVAPGYHADLVAFRDFRAIATWIAGVAVAMPIRDQIRPVSSA